MRVTKKALVLTVCLGCGMVVTGLAADSTPVNPSTSAPAMTFVNGLSLSVKIKALLIKAGLAKCWPSAMVVLVNKIR